MKLTLISFCLVSLKYSMDVQSSDGRRLRLKYVSSYVTKMKDHKLLKGLIQYIRSLHLYHILIKFVELSMQHILKHYLPNSKNAFFNKLPSFFHQVYLSLSMFDFDFLCYNLFFRY